MNISFPNGNMLINHPNKAFLFEPASKSTDSVPEKSGDNSNHAYTVSISRAGIEKLNQNKGFASIQMDVSGTIEAEFHRRYTQRNSSSAAEGGSGSGAEGFAHNAASVYTEMYHEIKKGYEEGNRLQYVADNSVESGVRQVTEEEEIAALDTAFDFHASYTEAYTRFVNEDKDDMLSGIQRTQDMWNAQKSQAMNKQEEYWQEQKLSKENDKEKQVIKEYTNLAEMMKQARASVKVQYGKYGGNVEELMNLVFEKMQK